MKKLLYKIEGYTDVFNPKTKEVEQILSLSTVEVENPSDSDIAKAQEIAYNGEYTIVDDGQESVEPSVWDELDAAYQRGVDSV